MDADQICLLEIDPEGEMQRRVIQLHDGGTWHEFEVARTFESEVVARAYAAKHGIEDVNL
jgi:hypothetical protein